MPNTDPDDRQIEQEYAGQERRPGQAERGRGHHALGAMMDAVGGPHQPDAVRAAMLHIKGEVGQHEQRDQARPVLERDRDGRQADLIDRGGDDAEDHAMHGRLGHEVPDRDQRGHPGVLPRVAAVPGPNHQCLGQDGEDENRQEDQDDRVWKLAQKFLKAEVEFHGRPQG
jgi:hypothetical protein